VEGLPPVPGETPGVELGVVVPGEEFGVSELDLVGVVKGEAEVGPEGTKGEACGERCERGGEEDVPVVGDVAGDV